MSQGIFLIPHNIIGMSVSELHISGTAMHAVCVWWWCDHHVHATEAAWELVSSTYIINREYFVSKIFRVRNFHVKNFSDKQPRTALALTST